MTTVIYWMPDGKPVFYNRQRNSWFIVLHYLQFPHEYLATLEVSTATIVRIKISMKNTYQSGVLTIGGIS